MLPRAGGCAVWAWLERVGRRACSRVALADLLEEFVDDSARGRLARASEHEVVLDEARARVQAQRHEGLERERRRIASRSEL